MTIIKEITVGKLETTLNFNYDAMIGVYMVPNIYPRAKAEKYDIYIDHNLVNIDNIIYGNVEQTMTHLWSLSSRSLLYFVNAKDLYSCYGKLYEEIKGITGKLYYRTDRAKFLSSYEQAGVSIKNGDNAIDSIKKYIKSTYNENVLGKFGDFGGQIKIDNLTLVSSIDGVGTKSILAQKNLWRYFIY